VHCKKLALEQIESAHSSISQNKFFLLALAVAWLVVIFVAGGCKKKVQPERLPATKIHAITREFQSAAKSAAPTGSDIRIASRASDGSSQSTDSIDITLPSNESDSSRRASIANIQQSLGAVATRHGLTEQPSESRVGTLFFYLHEGVPTHAIHIYVSSKNASVTNHPTAPASGPRLAVILDDLGSDRAAADTVFSLPYPLTISVLPNHEHSIEIAEEAHRRGYGVMLHLPMESVGKEHPEAQELRPGMTSEQVSAMVDEFLKNVPDVSGVNNHQGSEATADAALMSELMPVLRDRKLFYVDSRTTAATVAFDTAQRDGVRSAFRNVPFLDDVAEIAAVRKQLELAIRGAREKGEAIAIGHPHPATLQAIREVLPHAGEEGVQLVLASELVH
jgi:polysaccharide deacetylase 2 family uncharacterized protein YibQ